MAPRRHGAGPWASAAGLAVAAIVLVAVLPVPTASVELPSAPRSMARGLPVPQGLASIAPPGLPPVPPAGLASGSCGSGTQARGCQPVTAGSAAPLSEPWQQLHPRGAAPPFTGASMTFDGEDGYLLLFGANCSVACPAGPGFTWAYANGSWTNLSANLTRAPADRESAQMAYDAVDGYVVLFGGFSNLNGSTFDDTWTFRAGQWTPLDPGTRPPARSAGSFVWDPVDNYTLLFGGAQPGVGYYGDTWRFVHGNWSELSPGAHPNARYEQAMAWDDGNQYGVLFGGYGPTAPFDSAFNDTWAFSAGIWTNVSATAGTPPVGCSTRSSPTMPPRATCWRTAASPRRPSRHRPRPSRSSTAPGPRSVRSREGPVPRPPRPWPRIPRAFASCSSRTPMAPGSSRPGSP